MHFRSSIMSECIELTLSERLIIWLYTNNINFSKISE